MSAQDTPYGTVTAFSHAMGGGAPVAAGVGEGVVYPRDPSVARRPLKSRDTKWAQAMASRLAQAGVRPNVISVAGTAFAALAGVCLWFAGQTTGDWHWSVFLVLAGCGMQARLLCNLFDGMVAIEGGFRTKAGELFNELPDRFSDAFIFIGAAYSVGEFAWTRELGWAAAMLSVITAYVRALGASLGAGQHFTGPMAKPQRMAWMTAACLIGAAAPVWPMLGWTIPVALVFVVGGCLLTMIRRCGRIVDAMELAPR